MEPVEVGGNANANNQASNFFRLQNQVNAYNMLNPTAYNMLNPLNPPHLPTPILDGAIDLGSNVVGAGGLIGFDYAVLHYGSGKGGNRGAALNSSISTGLPRIPSPRKARDRTA